MKRGKPLGRNKPLTASAGLQRRTELKRGGELKRRAPVRPDLTVLRELSAEVSELCCGKLRFATEEAVQMAFARLVHSDHDPLPTGYYRCPNEWWHLTSQSLPRQVFFAVRKTQQARGTLAWSGRIAPVSPKRAQENRERRAMVTRLYGDERPLCTVYALASNGAEGIPEDVLAGCRRWADDLHEPLTRGRGGGIADEENQAPGCRPCHDVLTFRPDSELAWAYALGLLVHSWEARSA